MSFYVFNKLWIFLTKLELSLLQPKFGGKIIDIVSGDIDTPKQRGEALNQVKNTILDIFLVVVIGYDSWLLFFYSFD